jgi:hypothetical protein
MTKMPVIGMAAKNLLTQGKPRGIMISVISESLGVHGQY